MPIKWTMWAHGTRSKHATSKRYSLLNELSLAKRCHIGFLILIDLIMAILKLKTIFAPVFVDRWTLLLGISVIWLWSKHLLLGMWEWNYQWHQSSVWLRELQSSWLSTRWSFSLWDIDVVFELWNIKSWRKRWQCHLLHTPLSERQLHLDSNIQT